MRKTTVYSLYLCGGHHYLQVNKGYILEQGCAVYQARSHDWRVIETYTGMLICSGGTRSEAINKFRDSYLSKLTAYRLNYAEDYKAKVERMNKIYEDYVKGTC